jgi:cytochrome P450
MNDLDARLGNYTIPTRTSVFVNMLSIGHNVQTWGPNAFEFNLHQFLHFKMGLLGIDFELLPFGVGRCICVGEGLTMTMWSAP